MAERDVETVASVADFVAKLRRLADALESGGSFRIGEDADDDEGSIV